MSAGYWLSTLIGGAWVGYAVGTESHFPVLAGLMLIPGWWKVVRYEWKRVIGSCND